MLSPSIVSYFTRCSIIFLMSYPESIEKSSAFAHQGTNSFEMKSLTFHLETFSAEFHAEPDRPYHRKTNLPDHEAW